MPKPILLTQGKLKAPGSLCFRPTLDQRWPSSGHKYSSSAAQEWTPLRNVTGSVSRVLPGKDPKSPPASPNFPSEPTSSFLHFPHHKNHFHRTPWDMLWEAQPEVHASNAHFQHSWVTLLSSTWLRVVQRQAGQHMEVAQHKNKYGQILSWEDWTWVRETGWVITFDVAKLS